jgi:hypothetical protein
MTNRVCHDKLMTVQGVRDVFRKIWGRIFFYLKYLLVLSAIKNKNQYESTGNRKKAAPI